jgi:putative transposase
MLQVIALAQFAISYTRGWAANSPIQRLRLAAQNDQLQQEVWLLREEIRIKDARMESIASARRPRYMPTERLAILGLRAARGWSLEKAAQVFLVTDATIASWGKRLDESGPNALLRTPEPVNRFPEFVLAAVRRLQRLCPRLGKVKIAQILARAGLHMTLSTVGRMRKESPGNPPAMPQPEEPAPPSRRVSAHRPNHLWHIDLTVVPTGAGIWVPWLPFALPQCWPFCWWLAVVVDHYSRKALGFALFKQQPTSLQVRQFLGRLIAQVGAAPKYLVSDSGTQFTCSRFGPWCKRRGIRHRKGAIGQTGSIAVCERFIGTLKRNCIRLLVFIPLLQRQFSRGISLFFDWYNRHRPHSALGGATPEEDYSNHRRGNRAPRYEPRPDWPRGSPCATPQILVKGQPGGRLDIDISFFANRRHLPRVSLRRAA